LRHTPLLILNYFNFLIINFSLHTIIPIMPIISETTPVTTQMREISGIVIYCPTCLINNPKINNINPNRISLYKYLLNSLDFIIL